PRWFMGTGYMAQADDCVGTPDEGTISGQNLVCNGSTTHLTLDGSTGAAGSTREWFSSTTPGGPYTTPAGTGPSLETVAITQNMYYLAEVTCTVSGLTPTSPEYEAQVHPGF